MLRTFQNDLKKGEPQSTIEASESFPKRPRLANKQAEETNSVEKDFGQQTSTRNEAIESASSEKRVVPSRSNNDRAEEIIQEFEDGEANEDDSDSSDVEFDPITGHFKTDDDSCGDPFEELLKDCLINGELHVLRAGLVVYDAEKNGENMNNPIQNFINDCGSSIRKLRRFTMDERSNLTDIEFAGAMEAGNFIVSSFILNRSNLAMEMVRNSMANRR